MALRALAIVLAAGLCATPTPTAAAGCMPMDKPQLLTKENDLNLVANDVVFHHGTQRCNVTSITSVVADLAALAASVSQASATAKQDLVQGLGTASSALADLATKTSKDLAAEAKRIEDGHAADLAKLKKDLTVSYEAKLKLELQKQAADFGKQLAAVKLTIQQQAKDGAKANDAQDAANKKSNTAMTAAISSTKNDFQMPILKGWKHGFGCKKAQHGAMRRVEPTSKTPENQEKVVVCNGVIWKQIAPVNGLGSYIKIPGQNGCVMRDVYGYATGSGGHNRIDMKTNIKAKSSVMFTANIEGYNYGRGAHIRSSTVGYTYSGWSCSGNVNNRNYAYGSISQYCSGDGYVVIRYRPQGSSYYIGFDLSMRFTNPTGAHMCGKFKVLATKANSNF